MTFKVPEIVVKAKRSAKTKAAEAAPDSNAMESLEIVSETAQVQEAVINTPAEYFPIVGIGASAGGLAAFEAFFSGMPTDPGMAFVLVQHLAPDHESLLADLIKRYTRLQVFEVRDGMVVKPNCVYILPPGYDIAFLNGTLQLLDPSAPRGLRLPIDFFFRSLAQDQGERAIGIVLSGTGSDGTQGVRAIKAEGGMVIAQRPESTEFDSMPRSALATGIVDYELLPADMPAQLIAYAAHAFGKPPRAATLVPPLTENALQKIFILLRSQTGHDFSQYKTSTIHRRVERRMAVLQLDAIGDYIKHLQQKPMELEALLRDLLIGVTNFFRDPEAFKKLEEQVIPKVLTGKPAGKAIRVWSIGCSTGEEAYSIAILLQEGMAALKQSYNVQIFASDIDRQAIATARAGLYPASIAADLSPERLARFFSMEHDGSSYRIHKSIRDMVVFSEHNVIKDPPFSKLDIISCRNVMIYMDRDLQKKLMPLFHYALNPDGLLFLGSSETVGEFANLFATLDRKLKLYHRKKDAHGGQRTAWSLFAPPVTAMDSTLPVVDSKRDAAGKLSPRELTELIFLQQLALTGALVNSKGDILYLHGRPGMYLEPATGEVCVYNILKMAREGLRQELTIALHNAAVEKKVVHCKGLRVKTNGDFAKVNLTIHPILAGSTATPEAPLYLVIFEEVAPCDAKQTKPVDELGANDSSATLSANVRIAALRQELRAKEEYLQSANEELETSNEELKSTNEEMQSVNEELQSTNEELETSKEELQSINEELATVNAELQTKVTDLSQANNDMNNLLAGTGIATVFVDHGLRILRFTPSATRIINLIQSDVGRPVGHTVSNLVGYDRLVEDVQAVLNTLVAREVEVQTSAGQWYTMRILPYRTLDNMIEGAVLTFVDITAMKEMQETLRKTNALNRLAVVVRDAHDGMTVQDLEGRILAWNPAAERMYHWSESEALSMNIRDLIPEALREESLKKIAQLSRTGSLKPYRTQRIAKEGFIVEIWMTASSLVNDDGEMYAIATTERVKGSRIARQQVPGNGLRG